MSKNRTSSSLETSGMDMKQEEDGGFNDSIESDKKKECARDFFVNSLRLLCEFQEKIGDRCRGHS